jgi:predicted pyridoxine 5'-phosphate oxidase superfamily flavin-nucleotide-binding protein
LQHRGGPRGFIKVLGPRSLAFADYAGNRQYITVGNLAENDRILLLLIDYDARTRLKIWGRGRVVENDPELLAQVRDPGYGARVERVVRIDVEAWDTNCSSHIPHLVPAQSVPPASQDALAKGHDQDVSGRKLRDSFQRETESSRRLS